MRILVACEYSGTVRDAFKAKGHDAWSCDILPTESPGNHIQGDVLEILNDGWDMMIGHPPCTYLTVTANKWLKDQPPRKSGALVGQERRDARMAAIEFFMSLIFAPIPKIAIENPVGCMSSVFIKPNQIIQPYHYGHTESKKTCLWLKGLDPLIPTKIVAEAPRMKLKSGKTMPEWYARPKLGKARQDLRNKTFQGIADAMAEQWGQ